jgi:hypothetical protein
MHKPTFGVGGVFSKPRRGEGRLQPTFDFSSSSIILMNHSEIEELSEFFSSSRS